MVDHAAYWPALTRCSLWCSFDASAVTPSTPYIIMFGPDRCGATDKIHFIVRWRNPRTETWEEKHVTNAPKPANDKLSHLYTLIVRSDGTFTIKVDNEDVRSGSLNAAEDFSPPVLPSAEIDDPSDVKPTDWVDAAQIPDPEAKKPADWDETAPSTIEDAAAVKPLGWLDDEPASISDPAAAKPDEWDDEEDGAMAYSHLALVLLFSTLHPCCRCLGGADHSEPQVRRRAWLRLVDAASHCQPCIQGHLARAAHRKPCVQGTLGSAQNREPGLLR